MNQATTHAQTFHMKYSHVKGGPHAPERECEKFMISSIEKIG